ncbi:MAG: adenylate cyclase [Actinomycetota bacterium]|nr:adenylate cyclase [Actinomycetota bacterium]
MSSEVGVDRKRLDRRLASICTIANLSGAIFVFLYLVEIAPSQRQRHGAAPDAIAFSVFAVCAFALEAWWSQVSWNRALDWLSDRRTPSARERDATLRLPMQEAARSSIAWGVAAAFFALFDVVVDGTGLQAIRVAATIVDGGLITCAIVFLLFERALKPVFADALRGECAPRTVSIGVRPRLLLTWALGSAVPLFGLAALPYAAQHATIHRNINGAVLALSLVGLFVGLLMTVVTARSVSDPLASLRDAVVRIGDGQLDVSVPVDDGGEVGLLQHGVNEMVAGLRERYRLADLFGRHVGPEVARLALEQGSGLNSEQRTATAMFVDLVGSTALAEVLSPSQVVETLNTFFGAVAAAVGAEGGWVNKFQGDGALCVFGAPAAQPDHAARALRAARSLRARLETLAANHPGIDAAIGVSSGIVVAGNVGTEQRYEYTIIGGPVNEAARLTDLAKGRSGRVVASMASVRRAGDEASHWNPLGSVALRGQSAPTAICEPVSVGERVL